MFLTIGRYFAKEKLFVEKLVTQKIKQIKFDEIPDGK